MARQVAIVPHTHWDREWYASFAAFRLRLVDVLDDFLARLDADPSYTHFLLDGQMAVIDDYLEVRPGAEATLRRLAAAGRLTVGPWYILMDEFCVSGETIVRNLQLGLERAGRFGGAMPVGYLPDMFGHIAQMPQLLRSAGFHHAVVWRGVPSEIRRSGFWWRSPDGSTVRAAYLPVGYSNGAATPPDPDALVRRIRVHEIEVGDFLVDADALLWMNGTDHQAPQPWLGEVVAEANRRQKDFDLRITSLPEHLAGAPTDGLASWGGELRSGARTNILMGVLSNRVDVKVAAARTERELERRAEPLSALWLDAAAWPQAVLDLAWLEVIRNSAHDSICACSSDAVATAVLHRFSDATDAATGLAQRALTAAAPQWREAGPIVVNGAAHTRSGLVELVLPLAEAPAGTQLLDAVGAGSTARHGLGADFGRLLGELIGAGWLPASGSPSEARFRRDAPGLTVELIAERTRATGVPTVGPTMAEAWAQAGAARGEPLVVTVSRPASVRVLARACGVPGFGWSSWSPRPLDVAPVAGGEGWLDNGLVRVEVDAGDGTFAINGLAGLGRLVDSGDEGDTYNYSPPAEDHLVERPDAVTVGLLESGPLRGRLAVTRRYRWPLTLGADARRAVVDVRSVVELQAGERLVRVTTTFDNPSRDHRLRVVFPLPERAESSSAECAFATVTRGLVAEGGPHERGLATYPSRRFVRAGGVTLVHEGLLEYEVIDDGAALALTLLRATGHLSRPAPAYRPNAAGPDLEVEGPQLLGPLSLRYGVVVGPVDPYRVVDDAWLPFEVVNAPGGGTLAETGSRLELSGAEVSSLRRVGGLLEARVFNPSDRAVEVHIPGCAGWLVDLRGQALGSWEGSFGLGPWSIATARLAP